MKNFFVALLWFLLLAFFALLFHYFIGEKICGICSSDSNTIKQEQLETKQTTNVVLKLVELIIRDSDGKTLFKFPSNFIINSTNGKLEIPDAMSGFKDSIYNYLNANQGKELLISAKYLEIEGEPRGLDRASFLKDLLVKAGINPNRISPKAVLSNYSYDENNNFSDGIALLFRNLSDERLKEVEESIADKTLYSNFASTEFKADRTLVSYAYELKNYLLKYPDKKVLVTGHTDNVGQPAANYKLGLDRAQNVVDYLVSQGVDNKVIQATSKGETSPIADNTTEEGRALNRRITIKVK